jgi:cation diffusion facilitator family transporter
MVFLLQHPPQTPETFPDPVIPATNIEDVRARRLHELTVVTTLGILVRLIVIVAEFIGVLVFRSAAMQVDALASLFDVLSSLVLLAAIRFAARPPDDDHPFGHGRAEPLAGFQLGLLLCGTGIWMTVQNGIVLESGGSNQHISGWAWVIPGSATMLLSAATWLIRRAERRARSPALRAEAVHLQIDGITSLFTAVTLAIAALLPPQAAMLDHLGGCLLALFMVGTGAHAAWENLHQLLDRIPRPEDFDRVRTSALAIDGVIDVEKVRIQHAGPDVHVDIDIEVQPEISVAASHLIAQQVRARIQTDWPFVREVVVHVEPFYAGDH